MRPAMNQAINLENRSILTISELVDSINEQLDQTFRHVFIKGEISNFKAYPSGHFYFSLKDENAQISAVMFKGYNRNLKFELENGLSVIAQGKLAVYGPQGRFQIQVISLEPEGIGALQLAFDQLKSKLEKEGLFKEERKQPLPSFPKNIGVVTSEKGAAIHDIIHVLQRRMPSINITLYPVKVQGEGAAQEIASGISFFDKDNSVDVLIVGRGGGSLEDLWAFNEEIVARAISDCSLPIISAVGHETDFTISDFVADMRCPTPSAAAESAVPDAKDILLRVHNYRSQIISSVQSNIENKKLHVKYLASDLLKAIINIGHRVSSLKKELSYAQIIIYGFWVRHLKILSLI